MNSVRSNNIRLKYQRFTTLGSKEIGIINSEFVIKTQFLLFVKEREKSTGFLYLTKQKFVFNLHDRNQELTRVDSDRNIFSIKCGTKIYIFSLYRGLVYHHHRIKGNNFIQLFSSSHCTLLRWVMALSSACSA